MNSYHTPQTLQSICIDLPCCSSYRPSFYARWLLPRLAAVVFCVAGIASTSLHAAIFGETSIGTADTGCTADLIRGTAYQLSEAAVVTKLTVYLGGIGAASGSQTVRGAIYRNDGPGGVPGTLVAQTSELVVNAGAAMGWRDLPLTTTTTIGAGTYYLVLHTGETTGVIRYGSTSVTDGGHFAADIYSDGPAPTWGADGTNNKKMSIYATYTPNELTVTPAMGFHNAPIASQAGTFTAQFDAVPSLSSIDAVVSLSQGSQSAYTGLACIARFNPSGNIDARNGSAYAADSAIPFSAGLSYHFRLVIDVPTHTYSIFVTPAGGSELTVGANYAFRSEQASVTSLDTWNAAVGASYGGSLTVSNFTISGPPPAVLAPELSPVGGTYTSAQSVTITTGTSGATIRYTTDGSTPSQTNGTVYSGPVAIGVTTTLNAIAYKVGMSDSTVTTAFYAIDPLPVRHDPATDPNPIPLWGQISADDDFYFGEGTIPFMQNSRVTHFATGGPINDGPFRRFTVMAGDDYRADPDSSDRTEVGRNTSNIPVGDPGSTFFLYREGDRFVTSFWIRLPANFPINNSEDFNIIMQMKQVAGTGCSDSAGTPVIDLAVQNGLVILKRGVTKPKLDLWSTPAEPLRGGWHHFSFDIVYSVNESIGKARVSLDGGPYSEWVSAFTLKSTCSISHLRLGLYRRDTVTAVNGGDAVDYADIRVDTP